MRPRYAATEEKFLAGKEREKRGGRGLFAVAAAFDARSFHLETLGGVRLEMRANRGCCDSASTQRRSKRVVSPPEKRFFTTTVPTPLPKYSHPSIFYSQNEVLEVRFVKTITSLTNMLTFKMNCAKSFRYILVRQHHSIPFAFVARCRMAYAEYFKFDHHMSRVREQRSSGSQMHLSLNFALCCHR